MPVSDIATAERSSIGKYEGKQKIIPSVDVLNTIANYFNVTTDYLLGRTEDPAPLNAKTPPAEAEGELSETQRKVYDAVNELPDELADQALDYLQYLIDKQEKRPK